MRLDVLRRLLGGHGGRDYSSLELHADPLLHRLAGVTTVYYVKLKIMVVLEQY